MLASPGRRNAATEEEQAMAATKRQRQQTGNKPAASQPPVSTAGQPTISVRADRTAESLAGERRAMTMRRARVAGAIAVPIILIAAVLLVLRPFDRRSTDGITQAPATVAPAVQPAATAAPAAAAPTAAAPVAQATAVPAVQPAATTAPAAVAPQAAAPVCDAIAGLPVFTSAICAKHDTDTDDGVLKAENTYTSSAVADEVRRFYESAFSAGGWILQEFSYEVNQAARRLNVQVEAEQGVNGPFTKITLTERGAAAGTRTSCSAIEGLPAYAGSTCSDFEVDQDDGVLKVENTYTTSASPEEVRRFYADTFAKNSWAGHDFAYEIVQGQRRLKVDVETQLGAGASATEIKIAEQ
jgi:hypothetical protein